MTDQGESRIITARKEKVELVREQGINPYPNDFKRKNTCSEVRTDTDGMTPEQIENSDKSFTLA